MPIITVHQSEDKVSTPSESVTNAEAAVSLIDSLQTPTLH